MHREIMGLPVGDPRQVDHINRNKFDNRRVNLRLATQALNNQNMPVQVRNSSGYRGVRRARHRWQAYVHTDGQRQFRSLGCFDTPEEAAAAAAEGRRRLLPFAVD